MALTPKRTWLCLYATLMVILAQIETSAQSNDELYRSGQIGYANGNCVKAARFWFAYLIRDPVELASDPNRRAKIERVIQQCDEEPMRYASTFVQYAKKLPGKEYKCKIYAELAVAQFEASQLASCNMSGQRWHSDYSIHYNWCVAVSELEAYGERQARDNVLKSCAN